MTAALSTAIRRLSSPVPLATAIALEPRVRATPDYIARTAFRTEILAKMTDPDATEYYKTHVHDLDIAINSKRPDWCHWLIHNRPGYGDLMTSEERRRYGKTYPRYLELDRLLATLDSASPPPGHWPR